MREHTHTLFSFSLFRFLSCKYIYLSCVIFYLYCFYITFFLFLKLYWQLAADAEKKVEKLNPDEALCKYGQGGTTARTEACKRVKAAGGQLPGKSAPVKSLGGAYAM